LEFLERIDGLLKEKGMSRNALASEIDELNHNSFHAWKKYNTVPSAAIISKIADYFGVSTDYILGKTNKKNPSAENSGTEDALIEALVEMMIRLGWLNPDAPIKPENIKKLKIGIKNIAKKLKN